MYRIDAHKRSPITLEAIQTQAKLFQIERKALACAYDNGSKIMSQGVNSVRQICDQKGQAVAYHKQGTMSECAAGSMEKLLWDLSCLFGIDDLFVPTKRSNYRVPEKITESDVRALCWNKNGQAEWKDKLKAKRSGSLQPAIEGTQLYEAVVEGTYELSFEQASKATLGILCMGSWDAHSWNIMIQEDGRMRMFDNTRSMPNTNGLLRFMGQTLLPHRSGIARCASYYKVFSTKQRSDLQARTKELLKRLPSVISYLESAQTVRQLEALPAGWWQATCIDALKERLERMDKALASSKVQNLRDLSMAVFPDFRLIALFGLSGFLETSDDLQKLQQKELASVGFLGIDCELRVAARSKIGTAYMEELAASELSFDEILIKAQERARQTSSATETDQRNAELLNELNQRAQSCCTDVPRGRIGNYLNLPYWISQRCQEHGIPSIASEEELTNEDLPRLVLLHWEEDCYLIDTQNGQRTKVDLDAQPGRLMFDSKAYTPKQLAQLQQSGS